MLTYVCVILIDCHCLDPFSVSNRDVQSESRSQLTLLGTLKAKDDFLPSSDGSLRPLLCHDIQLRRTLDTKYYLTQQVWQTSQKCRSVVWICRRVKLTQPHAILWRHTSRTADGTTSCGRVVMDGLWRRGWPNSGVFDTFVQHVIQLSHGLPTAQPQLPVNASVRFHWSSVRLFWSDRVQTRYGIVSACMNIQTYTCTHTHTHTHTHTGLNKTIRHLSSSAP